MAAPTSSDWLTGLHSPLIQEDGEEKKLKLRFDVSQYTPEEIVVKTVDQKLLVTIESVLFPIRFYALFMGILIGFSTAIWVTIPADELMVMCWFVTGELQVHAKHEEKTDTKSVYREYNREFLLPKGTNPEMIRSSLSKVSITSILLRIRINSVNWLNWISLNFDGPINPFNLINFN